MALPVYQATGTIVESATAAISPAWPAHQAGDIGILIVETGSYGIQLTTDQGFRPFPCSPRGGSPSGADPQLGVFWKRATSGAEPAPTVGFVDVHPSQSGGSADHVRAVIVTIRGCASTGNPFEFCNGNQSQNTQTTNPSIPAGTTNNSDCLVMAIVSHGVDVASSGIFSAWTNPSLANIIERVDSSSIIGSGSGLGVATGEKAVAGAINNFSVTTTINVHWAGMVIGFTPATMPETNAAYIMSEGADVESSTAAVSPSWPPHQTNDIGLLIVESAGSAAPSTPSGWTAVPSSPQIDGVSGGSQSILSVFWKRAASGAESAPTVGFNTDHVRAFIMTVRQALASGNPFDADAGTIAGSQLTSMTFPAVTTLKNNSLVINIGTSSIDGNTGRISDPASWSNANLRNFMQRRDTTSIIGSGSETLIGQGYKDTAGNTGNSTATLASAQRQGLITLSFPPFVDNKTLVAGTGTFNLNGQAAGLLHSRVLPADLGTFNLVGQDVNFPITINKIFPADTGIFTLQGFPAVLRKRLGAWERKDPLQSQVWTKKAPLDDS